MLLFLPYINDGLFCRQRERLMAAARSLAANGVKVGRAGCSSSIVPPGASSFTFYPFSLGKVKTERDIAGGGNPKRMCPLAEMGCWLVRRLQPTRVYPVLHRLASGYLAIDGSATARKASMGLATEPVASLAWRAGPPGRKSRKSVTPIPAEKR